MKWSIRSAENANSKKTHLLQKGVTNHTFYMDQSGNPNIRAEVHKYVRSSFPDNRLFVNDYGILMDSNGRFSMFQQLIRDLLAAGAPIDGIGLQSHLKGEFVAFSLLCKRQRNFRI